MTDALPGAVLWLVVGLSVAAPYLVGWCATALDATWGPWRVEHLIAPP